MDGTVTPNEVKVRNCYTRNDAVSGSKEEGNVAQVNLRSLGVHIGGRQLYLLLSIPPSMDTCWHFQSSLEAQCGVESHGGGSRVWPVLWDLWIASVSHDSLKPAGKV